MRKVLTKMFGTDAKCLQKIRNYVTARQNAAENMWLDMCGHRYKIR